MRQWWSTPRLACDGCRWRGSLAPVLPIGHDGQLSKNASSPRNENISVYRNGNSVYGLPVSPDTRGASRSSRTWVEMRWTPIAQSTNAHDADGEVVWS